MEINKIAIIGAGALGRAIALASVSAGIATVLEDVMRATLHDGVAWIDRKLEETVTGGTQPGVWTRNLGLSCLETAETVEQAIREADLIIETVPDELEMKLELFTIFDKFAKPGAIFASTATNLSVADFSDVTVYRERCVGIRFLEVDSAIYRIELIKTPQTSAETITACLAVAAKMKKEVFLTTDSTGESTAIWPNAK